MKTIILPLVLSAAMLTLGGCASTPDPAEVCTAEWIAPRADRAVSKIERKAKSSIKTFSKVSQTWAEGKTPGPLQMWSLSNAFKGLEKELTRGQGIRDLKTVAKTCNDPKIVTDAMNSLMQRQGLSERMIGWIEDNPIYQRLVATVTAPEPVKPS